MFQNIALRVFVIFAITFYFEIQELSAGFYETRCGQMNATHKKNCNGNTLDYDFPLLKSKIEIVNIDPFNQQYRISADSCYYPCAFVIFVGICDAITGTSCITWSDYGDAVFKIGSGDVGSRDSESGVEILACSNINKARFREVNNSINATVCIATADELVAMYGGAGQCKYDVCDNIDKEREAEKNKKSFAGINYKKEEGILFVCGYAIKSGFFGFTAASNKDLIGCVPQPLKPGPPILNDVIVSANTPYVEEPPSALLRSFDKPSVILKRSESDSGLLLTHNINKYFIEPMKGSEKIMQIKKISSDYDSEGDQICARFGDSNRYYCAAVNDNGQVCAYFGQNTDDIGASSTVLSGKMANCFDPEDIIGCVDRPAIAENASVVIVPYYQVFVSEDNSRYPSVLLLEITGLKFINSVIGKDLDGDEIGIFLSSSQNSGLQYYQFNKRGNGKDGMSFDSQPKAANCDLLANALSDMAKNGAIQYSLQNKVKVNIGELKKKVTINHPYKENAKCILNEGVKVSILDVLHNDIALKSCFQSGGNRYDNNLCPKSSTYYSLLREFYRDPKNKLYLKGQVLVPKYQVLVDAIIPSMETIGGRQEMSQPAYVRMVASESNIDGKLCSGYKVDGGISQSDTDALDKNKRYRYSGYRDRKYCYCDPNSTNKSITNPEICTLCRSGVDRIAEEAMCPGSFPNMVLDYEDNFVYDRAGENANAETNETLRLLQMPEKICIMSTYGHWDFIGGKKSTDGSKRGNMICADSAVGCVGSNSFIPNAGNAIWGSNAQFKEVKSGACPSGYFRAVTDYYLGSIEDIHSLPDSFRKRIEQNAQEALYLLWYEREKGKKARTRGYISIGDLGDSNPIDIYIKNRRVKCRVKKPISICISGIFCYVKYPCIKESQNMMDMRIPCSEE